MGGKNILAMSNKTLSVISYILLIIALGMLAYKGKANRDNQLINQTTAK